MVSFKGNQTRWSGVAAGLWVASILGLAACSSSTPSNPAPGNVVTPPSGSGAGGQGPAGGAVAPAGGGSAVAGTGGTSAGGTVAPPTGGMTAQPAGGSGGGAASTGGAPSVEPGSTDWTMMGYDLGSTYFNRAETKLTVANAANLTEAWSKDMGGNVYGAPLQVGDKIYATGPSTVRAFDAATGNELWSAMHASSGSLAYADGTLYLNQQNGQVVALKAEDGSMLWAKQPDAQRADGTSSVLVAGDVVVVGGSNGGAELSTGAFKGYMAALNKMTGDVVWNTPTVTGMAKGAAIWSSPSADLAAGRVYGSTGNNYGPPATDTSDAIIAFELGTGTIVWKAQRVMNDTFGGGSFAGPDADFGANPVLYETMIDGVMTQLVSAGAKSGSAHAVRRDTGELVWTRSLGTGQADGSRGIFTNSTWSGSDMLFACNNGSNATLFALNGATGEISWMRNLPGLVWGRMAVANGVGFVGTGNALEVFDVASGAVIKSVPSKGGTVAGTITVANGRVAYGEGLSWSSGVRGTMLTVLAVP
jgi:outer membrane protein assembly factor BamB